MRRTLKNKTKRERNTSRTKSTKKPVTNVKRKLNRAVREKKVISKTLLQAEKIYASLSLTSVEEHELIQNLFISVLVKGFQRGEKRENLLFERRVVVQSNGKSMQTALAMAEEKIGRALSGGDDNDKEDGLSNPSNAEPKYKNVESILKYNETPDDKSTVKLVIMNFND